ncbi:hypothetical protein RF11_16520 [Thelohanellus kitauei]|uniref:Integrase catalytic domain-containing protein n=1 Tax=Thelohanellus kitauei TaxID=669202 RepID=A0A0C2NDL5_THEKT|nr:hypothetical protein RF11_16520 [Thelohanellus kitauei]
MADAGTKWIEVFPIKSSTSSKIILCLLEAFSRFGLPRCLVTDNGKQFTSNETTPYHSRSNGFAERAIRTIKDKFTKLENITCHRERLMLALFWYRNNIQSSTLRSPAELILGRKLHCTIHNLKPSVEANKDTATLKQKHYHDRGTQDRSFKVGDMFWIKNELKQGYRQGAISKTNGGPIIPGGVRRKRIAENDSTQIQRRSTILKSLEDHEKSIEGGNVTDAHISNECFRRNSNSPRWSFRTFSTTWPSSSRELILFRGGSWYLRAFQVLSIQLVWAPVSGSFKVLLWLTSVIIIDPGSTCVRIMPNNVASVLSGTSTKNNRRSSVLSTPPRTHAPFPECPL